MELLTTREFNGVALDCYKADNEQDGFWATREQIGRLLEYSNPEIAISKIHNRNKKQLDKFSTLTKLVRVEGGHEVEREVTLYNFKGFLEICRHSKKSKANDVMEFAWNIMDEIRRTGGYGKRNITIIAPGSNASLHDIFSMMGFTYMPWEATECIY